MIKKIRYRFPRRTQYVNMAIVNWFLYIQEVITPENEEMLATLLDYITSNASATVDLVKNGADFMGNLVEEAQNLSNVRISCLRWIISYDPLTHWVLETLDVIDGEC